jgi:hypothetical protein
MEYILNNCILALLDSPGNTMLGILRILTDKSFRKKIINNVKDPVVKGFWVNEYANYNERFRTEAIAPIQNKVGQFLATPLIRNIVGQPKSTIDMREIMDNRKILLMNLSKGRIGEDNSDLLGAMMITKLQLAAMGRVDIPEHQRNDFYLYVDEFQNFATEAFANVLSEARKYRLNLTIAHQYIEQMEEEVAAAVFGNVGTMVSFRVGAADAEVLEKEFTPAFTETDLVNLTKFNTFMKLMIDGVSSQPFSAETLGPVENAPGTMDKVIMVSRERYSNPRKEVEEKIARWSGMEEVGTGEEVSAAKPIKPKKVSKPFEPAEDLEEFKRKTPNFIQRAQMEQGKFQQTKEDKEKMIAAPDLQKKKKRRRRKKKKPTQGAPSQSQASRQPQKQQPGSQPRPQQRPQAPREPQKPQQPSIQKPRQGKPGKKTLKPGQKITF